MAIVIHGRCVTADQVPPHAAKALWLASKLEELGIPVGQSVGDADVVMTRAGHTTAMSFTRPVAQLMSVHADDIASASVEAGHDHPFRVVSVDSYVYVTDRPVDY